MPPTATYNDIRAYQEKVENMALGFGWDPTGSQMSHLTSSGGC